MESAYDSAVVDDLGDVHGHDGVHVLDGSIVPTALGAERLAAGGP